MNGEKKPQMDMSKLSDFEISMLIIERDTAQFKASRIDELLNEYGRMKGFVDTEKKETATEPKPTAFVPETTFNILKFEPQKGEKLGVFGVAFKNNNLPEKFSHAFGILRQNNAVINSRYCGPDYEFSYWLYGEGKIYRQKLKRKGA